MKEDAYDNDDEDGQKMVTNSKKEVNNRVGLTHYKTRLTKVYGIECTKTKQEIIKNSWVEPHVWLG
jgi:hypothetical protein